MEFDSEYGWDFAQRETDKEGHPEKVFEVCKRVRAGWRFVRLQSGFA
jgi:hypothetical protein